MIKKKIKTQITNFRSERSDITTESTNIKRKIREYCEQLQTNKFGNLEVPLVLCCAWFCFKTSLLDTPILLFQSRLVAPECCCTVVLAILFDVVLRITSSSLSCPIPCPLNYIFWGCFSFTLSCW